MGTDFIDYTVDMSPHKQGHLLPGSHIPIRAPEALRETKPDVVLILPWNLRREIMEQHSYVKEWGGRFAARAPRCGCWTNPAPPSRRPQPQGAGGRACR